MLVKPTKIFKVKSMTTLYIYKLMLWQAHWSGNRSPSGLSKNGSTKKCKELTNL